MRTIKAKNVKIGDVIETAGGEALVQDVEVIRVGGGEGERYRIVTQIIDPVVVMHRSPNGELNLVRRPT
jgi:hypothetical protein